MAIGAILWRGFIEQDRFALDFALQGVAHGAAHICVAARQRELRPFVVVKCGRRPPLVDMALRAFCISVLGGELAAVRIGVTRFTIRRRSLELNFVGTRGRFVTFVTSDRAMRPD